MADINTPLLANFCTSATTDNTGGRQRQMILGRPRNAADPDDIRLPAIMADRGGRHQILPAPTRQHANNVIEAPER